MADLTTRLASHTHSMVNGLLDPIDAGIVQTLAYADVFDYPLTLEEIHRFFPEFETTKEAVQAALAPESNLIGNCVEKHGIYYTLIGKAEIVQTRQRRSSIASKMWPHAHRYGRLI